MAYAITDIFRTVQGEGALLGIPMVFVRLAGCSIGCPQCDTDYRVRERLTAQDVCDRIDAIRLAAEWVWVTGGEPTDQRLDALLKGCKDRGLKTALATAGQKDLQFSDKWLDFVSVSPHGKPEQLAVEVHRYVETQINLVPGLNGLQLSNWDGFSAAAYGSRWVTPMQGCRIVSCLDFIGRNPNWRLGIQAHKVWGLS